MDPQASLMVLLVCSAILFCYGVEGGRWNISAEEDLEFERQLKALNKPSMKTIFTDAGVIFDCVDFYKQPAFDHALLNNYTIEYEYPISLDTGTKSKGCPIGSVPIKRITKADLIRESLASKVSSFADNKTPGAHYAVCRTKPGISKFVGAGCAGSYWNPQASGKQYSAGRLKIANGADSIEAGWRVDPALYGDSRTHLYVRTDAGRSHCFDTKCGFVVVDTSLAVSSYLSPVSQRGGPIHEVELFIVQNTATGNWFLEFGQDHKQIGFWPKGLFTGLAKLGASAEWGGEVSAPPGTPKPAMGAGFIPSGMNDNYDAYFRMLSLLDGQKTVIADNLVCLGDNSYQVRDGRIDRDPYWAHLMFYGGSATPSA